MEISAASDYSLKKAQLKSDNSVVRRPIPRIDDGIVREGKQQLRGRKKKYTPTKMKNAINKYFEFCETEDEVPSLKGMMIHLKMYMDQFYTYKGYPEFTNIMEHARLIIGNWTESDVYATKGLCAGKIAYMKNVHDWSDKLVTNNTTEVRNITVDEARAKIEMLAPKLLEVLRSSPVLAQIGSKTIEGEAVNA